MASNSNRDENLRALELYSEMLSLLSEQQTQLANMQRTVSNRMASIVSYIRWSQPLTSRFTSNNNSNSNSSNGGSLSFGGFGNTFPSTQPFFFNTRNNASQQHTNERRNRNSNNNRRSSQRSAQTTETRSEPVSTQNTQSVQQPSNSENATIQRMNDGSTLVNFNLDNNPASIQIRPITTDTEQEMRNNPPGTRIINDGTRTTMIQTGILRAPTAGGFLLPVYLVMFLYFQLQNK